jgi:hypothetical protein
MVYCLLLNIFKPQFFKINKTSHEFQWSLLKVYGELL